MWYSFLEKETLSMQPTDIIKHYFLIKDFILRKGENISHFP